MSASLALAQDRRDTGMALAAEAEAGRQPEYAVAAYAAILRIARRQPTVHVDDLLAECPIRPAHFNAAGAVWRRAIRDGLIAKSGELRLCASDPRKNAHSYPVYRSLVCGPRPLEVVAAPIPAAAAPAPSAAVTVCAHRRSRPGTTADTTVNMFEIGA